jgi:catechol 2,3-dioxygenase-like lactoylglutathione lyase family enzyme
MIEAPTVYVFLWFPRRLRWRLQLAEEELAMLAETDPMATVAVKNLAAAEEFYRNKLGLEKLRSGEMQVITYRSGNSTILVYQSRFAGTNRATAVTWAVDDVDGTVRALKEKGVVFERYEFPGVKHEGDVHVFGSRRNAWFKDPDGNILSVVSK